jgi:hypothetical protein
MILFLKVFLSLCVKQVVEKCPQLLGSMSIENKEAKVEFLLETVGVSEAKLGQVQNCWLSSYASY